jgi:hypothetical protein
MFEDYFLPKCDAVQSARRVPIIRANLLPPSSGENSKPGVEINRYINREIDSIEVAIRSKENCRTVKHSKRYSFLSPCERHWRERDANNQ